MTDKTNPHSPAIEPRAWRWFDKQREQWCKWLMHQNSNRRAARRGYSHYLWTACIRHIIDRNQNWQSTNRLICWQLHYYQCFSAFDKDDHLHSAHFCMNRLSDLIHYLLNSVILCSSSPECQKTFNGRKTLCTFSWVSNKVLVAHSCSLDCCNVPLSVSLFHSAAKTSIAIKVRMSQFSVFTL
jgi:hypothetical protein